MFSSCLSSLTFIIRCNKYTAESDVLKGLRQMSGESSVQMASPLYPDPKADCSSVLVHMYLGSYLVFSIKFCDTFNTFIAMTKGSRSIPALPSLRLLSDPINNNQWSHYTAQGSQLSF